jgi:hypothetical protein
LAGHTAVRKLVQFRFSTKATVSVMPDLIRHPVFRLVPKLQLGNQNKSGFFVGTGPALLSGVPDAPAALSPYHPLSLYFPITYLRNFVCLEIMTT